MVNISASHAGARGSVSTNKSEKWLRHKKLTFLDSPFRKNNLFFFLLISDLILKAMEGLLLLGLLVVWAQNFFFGDSGACWFLVWQASLRPRNAGSDSSIPSSNRT